jgi:gas vesicle protein
MSNYNYGETKVEGPNSCEQEKDILLPCKKDLKSQKIAWRGAAYAARTTKETYIASRDNKVCCVIKADETTRLYRNLDFYVAIDATCKAETIEKNIEDMIKKNSDLEKAIAEVVKCVKVIKDKTVELKAKACDLDTQRNDSCNNLQLNILNTHFSEKCKVKIPGGTTEFGNFTAIVDHIIEKTGVTCKAADKAFSSAVSIAGIQTFSNIKSLKDLSKQLTLTIKDFKKDIDTNVKSSADELKNAQDELAKAVKEVSLKTLDEHKVSVNYEGIAFTMDFLCNPDCQDGNIVDLCCKVMNTFCDDICGDEKPEGKPEYKYQNAD